MKLMVNKSPPIFSARWRAGNALCAVLCMALFSNITVAATLLVPAPPQMAVKAYLLQDFNSGQVLAAQNAQMRVEPASITKIMTAYIVFQTLKEGQLTLRDKVIISEKAWRAPGSRTFVEVGKQIEVESLIKGMIIQSGNDATIALAEHIAGGEDVFAEMMNHEAKRLGMVDTHYMNSTGLPDEEHYTTAQDLMLLTHALIKDFPEYYSWYSEKKFTFNGITQYNRNKLLWQDKTVDGVKTGHTESAGYCLITSALRDNMRLISIVLGSKSKAARASESRKLLNYGYNFYRGKRLYRGGENIKEVRVWKGEREELSLGLQEDLYITVPRRYLNKLKVTIDVQDNITAPVTRGQVMGQLNVRVEGNVIATQALIALQEIGEGSIWQRIVDEATLFFE